MPDNFRSEGRSIALEGVPYALPMRQFDLMATWTLEDCANRSMTSHDTKAPETKIAASLEATPLLTPGERYVVDYSALGSILKTSDFAIENHPEGTLKSINVAADDRTAETIVAVAKTGASLAAWVGGGGRGLASELEAEEEKATFVSANCSDAALAQLGKVKIAADALATETATLKSVSRQVEQLALAGMVDETRRTELAKQLEALRKASGTVDAAKKALAKAQKPLQLARTTRWPSDFADGGVQPDAMAPELTDDFRNLFVAGASAAEAQPRDCLKGYRVGEIDACLTSQVALAIRLEPAFDLSSACDIEAMEPDAFACRTARPDTPPRDPGQDYTPDQWRRYLAEKAAWRAGKPTRARDHQPDKGLFVRPPEQGRLIACRFQGMCEPESDDAVKVGDWTSVPQLGQLRFLPFTNRMFENNALVLLLAKDGTVEKFQYATKAAIAERLANAASGAAEAAVGGRKAWRAERLAELDYQLALDEKSDKVAALSAPPAAATEAVEEEAERAQRIALKLEIEIEDRLVEAASKDD